MKKIVKRLIIYSWMVLMTSTCSAKSECDALRDTGKKLLPNTTFEVRYANPLNGCFSGYLPDETSGLYQFGVFKNGEEVVSLPLVTAGMDLARDPYLKIMATSFSDLDHNGKRDVLIVGSRLAANGGLVFVQIYWGCGKNFVYDDKINSEVNWLIEKKSVVNVEIIEKIVMEKRFKSGC